MPFKAFYSEDTLGCIFWLVIHLKKLFLALTFSDTMIKYIVSTNDPNIFIDLYTLSIDVILVRKVLKVIVKNLIFKLDYTYKVELIEDPAI